MALTYETQEIFVHFQKKICGKNPKFELLQSFACDKQLVEKKLQAHNNHLQTYWDIEKIDCIKKIERNNHVPNNLASFFGS